MRQTAETDLLLRSSATAFSDVLHAVLDDDVAAARDVLRGSAERRRLLAAAATECGTRRWVPVPQRQECLQYVDDLGELGRLVDQLARHVVAHDDPVALTPARRMEVAVLLDAGGRRLRQLLAGPSGPALDPAYRGCGSALFEVVDHGRADRSVVLALCAALAAVLLQASKHATRAA